MGRIVLNGDVECLVDSEDMSRLKDHRWHYKKSGKYSPGYAATNTVVNGKKTTITMHRFLLGLNHFDKKIVDHIDRNSLNNSKSNLRLVTMQENNMNRAGWGKPSSSNYKGVGWCPSHKKWKAFLMIDKKTKNLGRFSCEKKAALAYNKAVKELHGSYAFLNTVEV